LSYFLHNLEELTLSHITKKRGNPYVYCVLKTYHFFL